MSQLGNIYLSYGKQFNIALTNTYSNIVLSGNNLPVNTIIISSNIDENNDDIGTYSIIATDSVGTPIRLTYTIKEGNGLKYDSDVLYLNIDNESIKNSSDGLYIDLSNIENNFISSSENKLSINNDSIDIISSNNRGTCIYDDSTIKSDDGTLYINTDNLRFADNATSQYGIITSSDKSINIDNGVISVNQNDLPKTDADNFGVCKVDLYSIDFDTENRLNINTDNLDKSNSYEFGIIKNDGNKIISNNGVLSINTNNLSDATYNSLGIINIDNDTIKLNSNDQISISNYDKINNELDNLIDKISYQFSTLENIENDIFSK